MSDFTSDSLELFNLKNQALTHSYFDLEEINLHTFFELLFNRPGYDDFPFEERRCSEYCSWLSGESYKDRQPFVYNALLLGINGKRGIHHVVLKDDEHELFIARNKFCITSPITYVGRSRNAKNARYLFALAFDLDGVGMNQLRDLNHQVNKGFLPAPSIVVNSGNGLHLYYLLEKPIALFQDAVVILQKFKHFLTERIWNVYTSTLEPQHQGIYQGFRVPTSETKFGAKVTAFAAVGKPRYWTCAALNKYIVAEEEKLTQAELNRVDNGVFLPDRLTRKRAKELYPEWYEKVIVKGERNTKKWRVNRRLYDWWLKKLRDKNTKVVSGHRYFCLLALASFGIKCQIPKKVVRRDVFSFVEEFDAKTETEDNHFTKKDAEDAFKAYQEKYCTLPRRTIEWLTGVRIDANKRNKQKQIHHLEEARSVRDIRMKRVGKVWWNKDGRPKGSIVTAENSPQFAKVQAWREANPDSNNKSQCARETGLSRPTVIKWWK